MARFSLTSRFVSVAGLALIASAFAGPSGARQSQTTSYNWSDDKSFILIKGGDSSTMMSGSMDHLRAAQRLRTGKEPLLYFSRGGKSYIVRDADVLRRAEAIVKPQQELGAKQGELGSRQGALGAKQAALGQQEAAAALRQVSGGHSDAAREQASLGSRQAELGRQQAVLGAEQGRLGRRQAELARKAQPKLRALMDEALRRGLAQEVS